MEWTLLMLLPHDVRLKADFIDPKFKDTEIKGDFDCSYHFGLKSLKGCPAKVGGVFDCSHTSVKSPKGCPREVGVNFYLNDTKVVSLHNIHKHVDRIGGFLYISKTVTSHLLGVLKIRGLRGVCLFQTYHQPEVLPMALIIINRRLLNVWNPRDRDIHACQIELIEAGCAEYAQL